MGRKTWHLATLAGLALPTAQEIARAAWGMQAWEVIPSQLLAKYTGYKLSSGAWTPTEMMEGWGPLIVGFVASKLATKLGINKMLPKGINL